MDGVYKSTRATFLHRDDSAPLASVFDGSGHSHELVNCSASCFFATSQRAKPPAEECGACGPSGADRQPYLQFTAELGPRFGSLWDDVASGDAADFGLGKPPAAKPTSNLWVGGAGVTTSTHYDSYHVRKFSLTKRTLSFDCWAGAEFLRADTWVEAILSHAAGCSDSPVCVPSDSPVVSSNPSGPACISNGVGSSAKVSPTA